MIDSVDIIGLFISNISFFMGLIGAIQTNVKIYRLLNVIDYSLLGLWTILYVSDSQKYPVFAWCIGYVVSNLYHFIKLQFNFSVNHTIMTNSFRGKHITLDFINVISDSPAELGNNVFKILRDSVKQSSCHEVFSKLVILDGETPAGFTSVVLLDESHITCHSYSEIGLLAIDVFTCGSSNPQDIANYINEKLIELKPTAVMVQHNSLLRFPF